MGVDPGWAVAMEDRLRGLKNLAALLGVLSLAALGLHRQIVAKVAPALAAGCTMILKPSEEAPTSAAIFAEIMDAAGVPAGVFNLVQGDGAGVGTALASHPDSTSSATAAAIQPSNRQLAHATTPRSAASACPACSATPASRDSSGPLAAAWTTRYGERGRTVLPPGPAA